MSNRKVSTDALETLGTIIDDTQKRDAIHLAVLPMIASGTLRPGEDVGVIHGKASFDAEPKLGIVDPFLKRDVLAGERFWLVLYPRMVTSLRHVWSHPAFPDEGANVSSSGFAHHPVIAALADEAGLSYDELMDGAQGFVDSGEYMSQGGRWEGVYAGDDFWDAFEQVTGKKVPEDNRGGIFSCSC